MPIAEFAAICAAVLGLRVARHLPRYVFIGLLALWAIHTHRGLVVEARPGRPLRLTIDERGADVRITASHCSFTWATKEEMRQSSRRKPRPPTHHS